MKVIRNVNNIPMMTCYCQYEFAGGEGCDDCNINSYNGFVEYTSEEYMQWCNWGNSYCWHLHYPYPKLFSWLSYGDGNQMCYPPLEKLNLSEELEIYYHFQYFDTEKESWYPGIIEPEGGEFFNILYPCLDAFQVSQYCGYFIAFCNHGGNGCNSCEDENTEYSWAQVPLGWPD
jgi:hypothetical protein